MSDQQQSASNFFELPAIATGVPSRELILGRDGYISFDITPTGGNVTGLKLQTKMRADSPYEDDLIDSDFASVTIPEVIRASAVPPYQTTVGNTGWARLKVGLVYCIRFIPTLSAGTVVIRGVK